MIVMKFGGSSLATEAKVRRCISLVEKELARSPLVVVSAHGKTTDQLIIAAKRALGGSVSTEEIEEYLFRLVDALNLEHVLIEPLLYDLTSLLQGVSLLRELTPRTLDRIMSFGERMSSRIVAAAMMATGIPSVAVNAYELGLFTTAQPGSAAPLPDIGPGIASALREYSGVPVITGFLGADKRGNITTLGRSGSDFSAAIIGAAVDAEEVQIWTDVNGVMSCNPSVEPEAKNLPILSFDEASELAYFGAEVLHPNTLVPVISKNIPVRVLNTLKPDDVGTVVMAEAVVTDAFAKSIVYKEDVSLITLSSPRLMSAVSVLNAAFEILREREIEIHMATTSEATVSMVTDRSYSEEQLGEALIELKKLGRVTMENKKAIVCVVGCELKGRPGVLGTIFGAVNTLGIKAKMVSQSATEINVAFLVDNLEVERTVRALHKLIV